MVNIRAKKCSNMANTRAKKCSVVKRIRIKKAEENVHAKSLRTFIGKHQELKGLRLSMMSYQDQGWMENRPLYAVGDRV